MSGGASGGTMAPATMALRTGMTGAELAAILAALRDAGAFGAGVPARVSVDNRERPPSVDWLERWLPKAKAEMMVAWDAMLRHFMAYTVGTIVKAGAGDFPRDLDALRQLLERVPFELASFRSIFDDWRRAGYDGIGFGNLHFKHGPACAFKGDGHRQLVSRRWLDFGPWRTVRGAGDLTVVQFHDLDADASTALAQARPGHERMGGSDTGGFIWEGYEYEHDIGGLYLPAQRLVKVIVHGRDVSQREMLDACAARRYQALGPERPLDNIAYVFMDEAAARAHLHELWLRELECWTMIEGREVRIDLDYHPVPARPEWVRRLDGAE